MIDRAPATPAMTILFFRFMVVLILPLALVEASDYDESIVWRVFNDSRTEEMTANRSG
jgi:hypothetical protein